LYLEYYYLVTLLDLRVDNGNKIASPPQSHLRRAMSLPSHQRMCSATVWASSTMRNVMKLLWNVTEALQSTMEPLRNRCEALRNVMEALQKRYGVLQSVT